MAILSTLLAFTLRQASVESGEQIVDKVRGWLVDPSLDLHKAIKKANDHTWHTVTLALGGEGWLDRVRGLFADSAVRGMRTQVQKFLHEAGVGMKGLDGKFRKNCLEELKRLKAQGRLGFESFDPKVIGQRAKDFRRYDDPTALAQEARRAAHQLAVEIVNEAPHLAQLLQLPMAGEDRPLLVTAFCFFFRHEIADRQELTNGMVLDVTERMYADQSAGFVAMQQLLVGIDAQMHHIIEVMVVDLDEIRDGIGKTKLVVDDTNSKVELMLDLINEQQRRIDEQRERDEKERREMRSLIQLLLDSVNQTRHQPVGSSRPGPFVPDAEQQEYADRSAVEELLSRSPLTTQVRSMLSEALDAELQLRRTQRGGRTAGTRKEGPLGMTLVWMPPGSFFMGSPTSEPCRDPDEFPHHVSITRGFWMGAHPVTRRQWWQLMRSIPDDQPSDDHPIEGVSWDEANEFLDVLVERVMLPLRLPTEAEWEYACRAGTVTPFAFGFRLSSDLANFNAATYDDRLSAPPLARREGSTSVGSFPPNAWGLYDMHGNVMEWCADWYGPYEVSDVEDPTGPQTGQSRVLRGGGWWSPVHACRSARRSSALPHANVLPAGFRVVLLERE